MLLISLGFSDTRANIVYEIVLKFVDDKTRNYYAIGIVSIVLVVDYFSCF